MQLSTNMTLVSLALRAVYGSLASSDGSRESPDSTSLERYLRWRETEKLASEPDPLEGSYPVELIPDQKLGLRFGPINDKDNSANHRGLKVIKINPNTALERPRMYVGMIVTRIRIERKSRSVDESHVDQKSYVGMRDLIQKNRKHRLTLFFASSQSEYEVILDKRRKKVFAKEYVAYQKRDKKEKEKLVTMSSEEFESHMKQRYEQMKKEMDIEFPKINISDPLYLLKTKVAFAQTTLKHYERLLKKTNQAPDKKYLASLKHDVSYFGFFLEKAKEQKDKFDTHYDVDYYCHMKKWCRKYVRKWTRARSHLLSTNHKMISEMQYDYEGASEYLQEAKKQKGEDKWNYGRDSHIQELHKILQELGPASAVPEGDDELVNFDY